jgi:hypothetical protein
VLEQSRSNADRDAAALEAESEVLGLRLGAEARAAKRSTGAGCMREVSERAARRRIDPWLGDRGASEELGWE